MDIHIAGHQLHFVKIVMEQNPKVFFTPTAIFQGYSLSNAIAQAVRVSNAFTLDDFHRQVFNVPTGGFCHNNISLHFLPIPSFLLL